MKSEAIAKEKTFTDAELLVLGLVAEKPRHGYKLEQVIEQRGMREWTQIGFSSIYFVLGKLEKSGLVATAKVAGVKAKKVFTITERGRRALVRQSLSALTDVRPTHSTVLLGMAHWPVLERKDALEALSKRRKTIEVESMRLKKTLSDQQPLPDFVEALFDFSLSQMKSESQWIKRTLENMQNASW